MIGNHLPAFSCKIIYIYFQISTINSKYLLLCYVVVIMLNKNIREQFDLLNNELNKSVWSRRYSKR